MTPRLTRLRKLALAVIATATLLEADEHSLLEAPVGELGGDARGHEDLA